tara:strand:+ start:1397 stop:1591 length:195 start_codon:yes stop_codon:yes gene_type:complete
MDTRTIHDVAKEMEAHERECVIYRTTMQDNFNRLEKRINRLEIINMTSTISVVVGVILVLIKGV